MRLRLAAVLLLALAGVAQAQDDDDFHSGLNAGRDAALRSNDTIAQPGDVLPEPLDPNNPALRGPMWRQGYREGYGQGEDENRDRMCAYGVSPFPCR